MKNRRTLLRVFFVLSSFGILSLLTMLSRSTLENIRAVDLVHLIGTGMCFGGAIVALIVHLRSRHLS